MALPQILMDSGFLYALLDRGNPRYQTAQNFVETTTAQFLLPYVILTEAAFLFNRTGGVPAVLKFMDALVAIQPAFEPILFNDLIRAREIMAIYSDAKLDFVDCCIMAISERLNITRICTFDQRDFSIFRPKHCDYLEVVP